MGFARMENQRATCRAAARKCGHAPHRSTGGACGAHLASLASEVCSHRWPSQREAPYVVISCGSRERGSRFDRVAESALK
jgi:hypothetical protein